MAKRIVVLGGGISGYGSAILAKKHGLDVFLSDAVSISPLYRSRLEQWGVEFEEGGHTVDKILNATEVIKSPGIPDKAPIVVAIREKGIPVISEMEFTHRYIGSAKTVCITGSNGKTTTTSLIYKILSDAGYNVALGGNIGESFAYSVATGAYDWYVLELSSFQLDGMFDFRANIAVLKSNDCFIYSADDNTIMAELTKHPLRSRELPFMAKSAVASGAGDAYLSGDSFTARVGDIAVDVNTEKMQIKGLHNAYDAMAAALAALAAGVAPEQVAESIYDFSPVEHRLEPVAEIDGVQYINDSKATNVDSVWYALESMTRPVVWIAGGTDKGNDYAPLMDFARAKVHTLICMGIDNTKLERDFAGVVPTIVSTDSLDSAMRAAVAAAKSGDTVLLSPACASFDLFKNYCQRGELFKEWVNTNLKK